MRLSKICHIHLLVVGMTVMSLSSLSYAQSTYPFVDPEFKVPETLETELTEAVKAWLASDWPFKNPALPGTGISEEEWEKLPDLKR